MEHSDSAARWYIRTGRDTDGSALIALIWACWSAYPGIRMDVEAEMPELHALATYYTGALRPGALWVAEIDGAICGMVAVRRLGGQTWEICRVYVEPAFHGCGLGHALLDHAERHAIAAGADRMVLWSDTRFDRAHRFYEKRSYVRHGAVRVLNDISNSLEYGYAKPINGIQTLDIAAAESAVPRLVAILVACVDSGAAVGFLKPLAPAKARDFRRRTASDVGAGTRVLVGAWRSGVLLGFGALDLETPETQAHRARLQSILVDPDDRRGGLGRQILDALEQAAAERGRTLLTAHAPAGEAGELLLRRAGWTESGRIPSFTHDAVGNVCQAVFFWKQAVQLSTG
jgi:GNAT superfamily N-acetyltransferase